MLRQRNSSITLILTMAALSLVACHVGPAASGSFDRNYAVTGPLEWRSPTPPVTWTITGSADVKCTAWRCARFGMGFRRPAEALG